MVKPNTKETENRNSKSTWSACRVSGQIIQLRHVSKEENGKGEGGQSINLSNARIRKIITNYKKSTMVNYTLSEM